MRAELLAGVEDDVHRGLARLAEHLAGELVGLLEGGDDRPSYSARWPKSRLLLKYFSTKRRLARVRMPSSPTPDS